MVVDINKIIFSFLFAVLCGFTAIILQSKFSYIIFLISCIVFVIYYGFLILHYNNNNIIKFLGIFFLAALLIDLFGKPHIKDAAGNIIFALGYVFLLLTVYFLISYKSMAEILVNNKSSYIIKENFKYAFIPAVIFTIFYCIIGYPLALSAKEFGFEASLSVFLGLSYIFFLLMIFKLYKYMYAFKLLSLLDNKKVPYTDIDMYPQSNKIKFVEKFIYPYIKNVEFYDDTFIVSDIPYSKPAEYNKKYEEKVADDIYDIKENNENTLSESIRKLDNVIKKVENSSEVIYNTLCSIKEDILKIDKLYKTHNQLESYINDINMKYIPYISNITNVYIENMALPKDITADIQKKIEESIIEIKNAFDEILKSMFNMKKIDIESSIDVMNIQLMQDGLININKKGR